MRLTLFITFCCISCLSFGQDSLQVDTTHITSSYTNVDSTYTDSLSSAVKDIILKNNKKRKKAQKPKIKEEITDKNTYNEVGDFVSSYGNILIIAGILLIAIILGLTLSRLIHSVNKENDNTTAKDENFMSDYFARMVLSRQDYYRNVYLKSEAWKRKRYVVLKRDNWRCVYCGAEATEVHHTRYAKKNIGNEPIEWLVSICRSCHESLH